MRTADPPSRQVVQPATFPAFVCYGHSLSLSLSRQRVVRASCKCIGPHDGWRGGRERIVFIIWTCPPALSSISDSTIVFSISGCYCPVCLTIIARTTRDPANEFDWLLTGGEISPRDCERTTNDNLSRNLSTLGRAERSLSPFLISGTPLADAPV